MIRELEERDIEAVVAIADRAWQKIWAVRRAALGDAISDRLCPEGDAKAKGASVRRNIASGAWKHIVCEEEGEVVGFLCYRCNPQTGVAEIGNNAVDPDRHLKGRGQQMYQAAFDVMRAAGMKVVYVETGLDEAHAPARRAYQRAGFDRELHHVSYFREL